MKFSYRDRLMFSRPIPLTTPKRHGPVQPEGIPDGQHPLTDLDPGGSPKRAAGRG